MKNLFPLALLLVTSTPVFAATVTSVKDAAGIETLVIQGTARDMLLYDLRTYLEIVTHPDKLVDGVQYPIGLGSFVARNGFYTLSLRLENMPYSYQTTKDNDFFLYLPNSDLSVFFVGALYQVNWLQGNDSVNPYQTISPNSSIQCEDYWPDEDYNCMLHVKVDSK